MDGASYLKRTDKSMCDELGDENMMVEYVESAGKTVLCGVDGRNCNEKETRYIEKIKVSADNPDTLTAQLARLEGLLSKGMGGALKEWNFRRQRILRKFLANLKDQDEL